MRKGAIVLVQFPFTDYSSKKLRPALVVSVENKRDLCVVFISSVVPSYLEKTDYVLKKDGEGFAESRLKKSSVIRVHKILTVDKGIVKGKLGDLPLVVMKEIEKRLRLVFGL